jgi:cellobiose epimerase
VQRVDTDPLLRPSMRETLRTELEVELRRIIAAWFPRSVDRERGGFLCDFNYRWRLSGSQRKMLEFQARQTIAAARCAIHFPDLAALREIATHGFRYLKEMMWDHSLGGWYRLLDQNGTPREKATKHGHGSSYAISACVACYELTQDPQCLELAKSGFLWLERHAHDDQHGGYFVYYQRDGIPILSPEQAPQSGERRDHIGTPIGFKDANTTTDLLRAFADLYRVWPDPLLRERLQEVMYIVRDRFVVSPGVMHMYLHPNLTPLPDFVRYGQALHAASHMMEAAETLVGHVEPTVGQVARSIIDTMLTVAWDSDKGGFYLAGSSFGPTCIDDIIVIVKEKRWWVQADGMKPLLAVAITNPGAAVEYASRFLHLWSYVKKYIIDPKRGGWLASGLDSNSNASRLPKATMWKDCSHEVEALLGCRSLLVT